MRSPKRKQQQREQQQSSITLGVLLGSPSLRTQQYLFSFATTFRALIVIFTSRYDPDSVSLATRWAAYNANVLTSSDLSVVGWRHDLQSRAASKAVVRGTVIPVEEIKGVLIRWPGVFPQELTQITPEDRDYVSREMMAFLVSWFSDLRCPVVNQPTPVNLTGPAWRLEQWTHAAAQIGIPVREAQHDVVFGSDNVDPNPPLASTNVTVVGDRCFGEVEQKLRDQAIRLAKAAGVSLLSISFSGPEANSLFVGADLLPKLSAKTEDAVLELLMRPEAAAA